MISRSILMSLILLVRGAAGGAETRTIDFNRDVRPILSGHCFQCHGPDKETREAGLRLDIREGLLATSSLGTPIVTAKAPEHSELFRRIQSNDMSERMPPGHGKPLSPQQMEILKRWIDEGAVWNGHWSYQPVRRPPIPKTMDSWSDNPIDAFLRKRWSEAGLNPVELADSGTLARRLSFDLTGLPPRPSLTTDIKLATDADGISQQIEQLLAAPQYGERMAVYWLDLVRYADSCGYHSDVEQHVSPYRTYVISAFNSNLPFDQFTREQIAGDLLPDPTLSQRIATGFNRLNKTTEEGGAQEGEYLAKALADRVRTVSGTWLAATLGCAECHDHKFDPLTTRDFYSLGAFFADIKERGVYGGNGRHDPELALPTAAQLEQSERLIESIRVARERSAAATSIGSTDTAEIDAEIKQLEQQSKDLDARIARTLVTIAAPPREIRILPRGDWLNANGEVVQAAVPAIFASTSSSEKRLTRLDLAEWLMHRDNPLTARVFVNRIWKLCFGVGLAKSLDDLGAQSEAPVHPELLDWLAAEFMDSGWDVKSLIRQIVNSRAYRLSSVPTPQLLERDPQNRFFARQSRWRLEAEFLRDNALSISGLLVERIGGPSVKPYQPEGYWEFLNFPKRTWNASLGPDQYRRGLYTHWQRTFLHPSLLAFDAPSREECTAIRATSNTPKSALALLNDPTYVEAARVFAERILREAGDSDESRLKWAWETALSRRPDEYELTRISSLLIFYKARYLADAGAAQQLVQVGQSASPSLDESSILAAWTAVARNLLNLHEFTTRN